MTTRLLVFAFLLAGCASGPFYWTKPGATNDTFLADHGPCFQGATIGYGIGSEKAYKACMFQKGWTRIQGTANAFPTLPHFRGPEGDDEFTTVSSEDIQQRTLREQNKGRVNETPLCDRLPGHRPAGVVCP